ESDLTSLRAAIDRATTVGQHEQALAIAAALQPFWLQRNHSAEGLGMLVRLVDDAGGRDEPEVAAAAAAAADIATWLGDYATGRRMGQLAVNIFRRLDDRRGLASAMGAYAFALIEVDAERGLERTGGRQD